MKKLLILAGCLIVFIAVVGSYDGPVTPSPAKAEPVVQSPEETVGLRCQVMVHMMLKSPSTARFPTGYGEVKPLGNGLWQASNVFDAQNSFGAMMRGHYRCSAQIAGTNKAIVESLWVNGKQVAL